MRLVFMGSPDFSVPVLAALIEAGHEVVCVYSQPPRPAGRGQKEQRAPVHAFAEDRGLAVRTPETLKASPDQDEFRAWEADAAVVVAYGLILPAALIDAPRLGCWNVHASLLPRWRGAAPLQRAIMAGDTETGVSIMKMDAGLDTGPVLMSREIPLTSQTTAPDLHDALSEMGAALMVEALEVLATGEPTLSPQPEDGVTYAAKLRREEGRLDWQLPAVDLERQVRALNPWPGVWFEHGGERIKVLAAVVADDSNGGTAGTAVDDALGVACGSGVLRLLRVCRAGKSTQDAATFIRGFPIPTGTALQ
ncbi:MAG: methionyl-tRNA formyltransferase [Alphaproteobacteria bacterium]|nr:methionyl-tRNA formyltransferase [Alphaproteobacteria bacterium]MBT7942060.1 methionyl-tRNA formyltransferase [Alphaproteobacteria bacterium]